MQIILNGKNTDVVVRNAMEEIQYRIERREKSIEITKSLIEVYGALSGRERFSTIVKRVRAIVGADIYLSESAAGVNVKSKDVYEYFQINHKTASAEDNVRVLEANLKRCQESLDEILAVKEEEVQKHLSKINDAYAELVRSIAAFKTEMPCIEHMPKLSKVGDIDSKKLVFLDIMMSS